jgi:hypothetical protein
MSKWRVGKPGSTECIFEGNEHRGYGDTPEQATRITAMLNEREQLRVACFTVKDYLNRLEGLPEDDPLLAMRLHFHAPLHKALDAALAASEPSTPAKEP